jgi:serine phosphatase RsbU (regulator of sigma subunit)
MEHKKEDTQETLNLFHHEIKNLREIVDKIKPLSGEIPVLKDIDIYGETVPLNGIVGGDHIVYVDFNQRYDLNTRIKEAVKEGKSIIADKLRENKTRAGIMIADVSGHNITDAIMAAMLHQAFLIGVLYELNQYGEITTELFENINTRFFNSSSLKKFITLIYGEISEKGKFKFLSAGHAPPALFSNRYNRLVKISSNQLISVQPIGTLPSKDDIDATRNLSRLGYKKRYNINEINLMDKGDILTLYTDGLSDHVNHRNESFFPERFEQKLKEVKHLSSQEIFRKIIDDIRDFGSPSDDISMVIIKKV